MEFIGSTDGGLLSEYKEDLKLLASELNLNINCDFQQNLEQIGLKKSVISGERDVVSHVKGGFTE